MNIEVIEFYPRLERRTTKKKKNKLHGSLHIYIIDYGIDLRGVNIVRQSKNCWLVSLPYSSQLNMKTKQFDRFPIFNFIDQEKTASLLFAIKEKGRKYIEETYLKQEGPAC